jgi:hypothetical protein
MSEATPIIIDGPRVLAVVVLFAIVACALVFLWRNEE